MTQEALPDCLERATTNLLRDNFGCETDLFVQQSKPRESGQRGGQRGGTRGGTRGGRKATALHFESEEERMFAELLLREKEDRRFLETDMSMSDCEYDIDTEVPNIIPLGETF